jgi:hypothetical protein
VVSRQGPQLKVTRGTSVLVICFEQLRQSRFIGGGATQFWDEVMHPANGGGDGLVRMQRSS